MYKDGEILPDFVDWRSRGAVGLVKDQGRCKCCWAFSAIAAIEGINQITTGEFVTLSEQQILDCEMTNTGCCKTGYVNYAYEFVIMNGGIDADTSYPYHGKKKKCKWNGETVVGITNYEFIPRYSERSLQKAVANQPISVVIRTHCIAFQFYKSVSSLRHAMVVVGFGNENGEDYWIVKNSWGDKWGENGYIRMKRNVDKPAGVCGITTYASYPLMTYSSLSN
ncbi:unnamed protein product [Spirodela intermedia]|uniref:Peptidase C1A papain C-terminal domain-containing protein n=1 Tax=Spirodela intermedia TaxID=51605 RepID=A0A7I8JK67_SPIIN|nr:unnamed protein product [Spirodela intermedia]CAA6670576.1 unnamed protein product [Spirodela intermedia]